ncbi:MAG: hypothetical protein IKS19_00390 [Clostridia bacterium]|nr:hypothetical protein [Clostridia bacterium]
MSENYNEYLNGEYGEGQSVPEPPKAEESVGVTPVYVKIKQPTVNQSAVMDNVKLMDDNSDLLSGLQLDPKSEDIGFGENALQPWNKPVKPKKPKKRILRWILLAALIAAIAITAVLLLVGHIKKRQNAPAPVNPEGFPVIYSKSSGELCVLPSGWDESYTAVEYTAGSGQDITSFVKTNNTGSIIFYADSAEAANGGQYNLCYRKSGDSSDEAVNRIASNVMGDFAVSRNGNYVAYLKDVADGKGKLYVSNLYYETAVEERDVVSFGFSNDNNYIMYHKNSGEQFDTVYIKKLSDNSEKIRIDNNVVRVISCSDDFERIYYLTLSEGDPEEQQNLTDLLRNPESHASDDDSISTGNADAGSNDGTDPSVPAASQTSASDQESSADSVLQLNQKNIAQKSDVSVALTNGSGDQAYVYDPYTDDTQQYPFDNMTDVPLDVPYDNMTDIPYDNMTDVPYYDPSSDGSTSDVPGDSGDGSEPMTASENLESVDKLDKLDVEDVLCTFKLKLMSREPIKIVDGVTSVSEVSEKGNFAFTMGSTTILKYDEIVDDEDLSSDAIIHEPTREEYTVTTEVPNPPVQGAVGNPTLSSKTISTFDSESYDRAMNAYRQKAKRDEVRNTLKDQTITVTNNVLYCFVDGSIIKVSNDCDQYYAIDLDNGLIAFAKRETESIKRYRLSELMDDPMKVIRQTGKSETITLYRSTKSQVTELSRAFSYSAISQSDGNLYYLTDYDASKQKGTLMQLDKKGLTAKLMDDVSDYRINEKTGNIAYLTNLDSNGEGELYLKTNGVEGQYKVADSVRKGKFVMDDKGVVAALSGSGNTLISYNGTNSYTIAVNVESFCFKGEEKICLIQDYDSSSGGVLSLFTGSDIEKISENVTSLFWPYNETVTAGE